MIDKRFGKRVKACREQLGLTQELLAEKISLAPNYISTVECVTAFLRYDKLIAIFNGLEVSADALFCDVVEHGTEYKASRLSRLIEGVSSEEQHRILEMVELMVKQARGPRREKEISRLYTS